MPGRDPWTFDLGDGASLSWLPFGDPDGPVALLAPGLTDGLAPLFHPPAARAAPPPPPPFRRLRVLVASHRRPVPEGWGTDDMAADLAAFVEAVADGPVVAVGHSMGAMVALHLAGKRPDLVARLVVSAAVGRADAQLSARLTRWERLLDEGRWREFHRDAVDASFVGAERWRRRALLRLHRPDPPPAELVERHLALSAACRSHDATGVLDAIAAPTLVVSGARDALTRPERGRELATAIDDARFLEVPGAGHGVTEQRPRAYARVVADFLADVR